MAPIQGLDESVGGDSRSTRAPRGLFRGRRLRCREPERRRPSGRSPDARALPGDGRRRSRPAHRAGCHAVPAPSGPLPGRRDRSAHAQGLRPVWTAGTARAARPGDWLPAVGTSRRCSSRSPGTASRRRSSTACSARTPTRRCGSSSSGPGSTRTEPQAPSTYAALRRPVPRSPIKLLAPVAGAYGDLFGPRGQSLPCGHRHPGLQGDARRRSRSRASRLRSSGRGVRQARRGRARTRRQDALRAPVADHRPRRPVREGPRHRRPRGRDGRGDRPAPALRGAGAWGQRGSIVRPLTRTNA